MAEVVEGCGHEVYVANTRKVPFIHASDDKNDPGDAYKLAALVGFKPRLLHPIQHRSREAQADLSWIRAREVLVENRTQVVNVIRGISKGFGERLQKCSVESLTAKLADQVPEVIRGALAPLLETVDYLNEQIRYYDQMEEHIAREGGGPCPDRHGWKRSPMRLSTERMAGFPHRYRANVNPTPVVYKKSLVFRPGEGLLKYLSPMLKFHVSALNSLVFAPKSKFTRYTPVSDRLLNIRKPCTTVVALFNLRL